MLFARHQEDVGAGFHPPDIAYRSRRRRLILEADVPAIAAVGLASICELELRWVDVESMRSDRADIPVHVNVVPGDQAAGRTTNAEVTTELNFQQAQRAKREASDALAAGDVDRARRTWNAAAIGLQELDLSAASPEVADEIVAEARMLDELAKQAETDQILARKRALADHHMKSRKRGRDS